jgi:hypothetical protein
MEKRDDGSKYQGFERTPDIYREGRETLPYKKLKKVG